MVVPVAFDGTPRFWLLCPYDLEALTADIIDEAQRTHPYVARGGERRQCGTFQPIDIADPFARPVPPRPADAAQMPFETGGLRRIRAFVAEQAERAGLEREPAAAMVLAVNEIATNSLQHGGGPIGQAGLYRGGSAVAGGVEGDGAEARREGITQITPRLSRLGEPVDEDETRPGSTRRCVQAVLGGHRA